MKIISFAVDNFRGIGGGLENNRIIFDDSNTIFIFGQNNVGKSTFLLAYEFFYAGKSPLQDDLYNKDTSKEMAFELEAGIDAQDLEYIEQTQEKKLASFKKYLSESSSIKIRRTFTASEEKGKIKISNPKDETYNPIAAEWNETAFGSLGLSSVFQYLLPTPILIKAMPTEEEVENVVNEILASKAKRRLSGDKFAQLSAAQETVKALQDEMYSPIAISEYRKHVNEHFSRLFPDIELDFLDTDKVKWTEDKFGKKFEVQFQKKDKDGTRKDNIPTSYGSIGHGAVRGAIFSLLLMRDVAEELERIENRKDYLILFEEPELFLHPKIMRELRELIYMVSEDNYPYQILCASHSPQMIDISKKNSSLVRMVRGIDGTKLFQISDQDLREAKEADTADQLRQELFEVLRFNPYICESFYADEVILIEGPTEEILLRGILQNERPKKELFIVNCNTVNNIPFYIRVYTKFSIRFHVICDSDDSSIVSTDEKGNSVYDSGIQRSISELFVGNSTAGLLRVHSDTFESAHQQSSVSEDLRYPTNYVASQGKPFNANRYWKEVLAPRYEDAEIGGVPIVRFTKDISNYEWPD